MPTELNLLILSENDVPGKKSWADLEVGFHGDSYFKTLSLTMTFSGFKKLSFTTSCPVCHTSLIVVQIGNSTLSQPTTLKNLNSINYFTFCPYLGRFWTSTQVHPSFTSILRFWLQETNEECMCAKIELSLFSSKRARLAKAECKHIFRRNF